MITTNKTIEIDTDLFNKSFFIFPLSRPELKDENLVNKRISVIGKDISYLKVFSTPFKKSRKKEKIKEQEERENFRDKMIEILLKEKRVLERVLKNDNNK